MTWQGTDNGLSFTNPNSDTSQPFGEGNNNIINPLSPNVHILIFEPDFYMFPHNLLKLITIDLSIVPFNSDHFGNSHKLFS